MFWAFHRQCYGVHREYARPQPGDTHTGSRFTHRVFMHPAGSGDVRVYRGQEPADAERPEAHQRFRLVTDREYGHAPRKWLSIAGDDA